MQRQAIIDLLKSYKAADGAEKLITAGILNFIQSNENCFERSLLAGHVTGSAWIVNPEKTHVLLIHHRKLDKWLQPGGHCDGDGDVLQVAVKEAFEETGLDVKPIGREIFDADIHEIPEHGDVPKHFHYDIRFLFEAQMDAETLPVNYETKEVRWVPLAAVTNYNHEASVMRMVSKTYLP